MGLGAGETRLMAAVAVGVVAAACSDVRIVQPRGDDAGGAASTGGASSDGGATMWPTGGAGGAAELCPPGLVESCYDGPAETLDVGACSGGTRVCSTDGYFGPCEGQTLPTAEDCSTLADESCDGQGCPGQLIWASQLGGEDEFWQEVWALDVDPFDNVLVAGELAVSMEVGGTLLTGGDYLAKLDPNGAPLWGLSLGMSPFSVKSDTDVNVIVLGASLGIADFGAGPVGQPDAYNTFVLKLDPNGNYQWSRLISGPNYSRGLGTDAEGAIFVGGTFASSIDTTLEVDGDELVAPGSLGDLYVLKLDASGALLWARAFGDDAQQNLASLDVTALGHVVIAADSWGGTFDLGGDTLVPAGGTRDLVLAELDGNGDHVWSRRFGGGTFNDMPRLTVDALGNAFVAGSFSGDLDFGTGALTGEDNVYLAMVDSEGSPVWSKGFTGMARASAITLSLGGPVIAGYFFEQLDLGGELLVEPVSQVQDAFLGRFLTDGSHQWSHGYGGGWSNAVHVSALATDSNANIVMAGDFVGSVDLGGELLDGYNGIFIAKISP